MGCAKSTSADSSLQKPDQNAFVFSQTYELREKLSSGTFGEVYSCQHRSSSATDVDKAAKAVKVVDVVHPSRLLAFQKEESIWRVLCGDSVHPNCIRLIGSCIEDQMAYMVMERCQISLHEYVEVLDGAAFPKLARTIQEMLLAVAHVHQLGIMHRDIKLHNYLQSWDYNSVKLCDFGLATEMPKKGLLQGQAGTPSYMAPEVHRGKGYDHKADIWSLGVAAYVLAFTQLPYKPVYHGVKEVILSGKPEPSFRSNRSSGRTSVEVLEIGDFIRMLLDRSPEVRCSAENALQLLPDFATVGLGAKSFDKTGKDVDASDLKRQISAGGLTVSTRDDGTQRQLSPGGESFYTCDDESCCRQQSIGGQSISTYDGEPLSPLTPFSPISRGSFVGIGEETETV